MEKPEETEEKEEDDLTTGQIAKYLNLSEATVRGFIDEGLLIGHRIPGSKFRRVCPKHLRQFLQKHPQYNPEGPRRLAVEQFADLIGVSTNTIDQLIRNGTITVLRLAYKRGKARRFIDPDSARKLLEQMNYQALLDKFEQLLSSPNRKKSA